MCIYIENAESFMCDSSQKKKVVMYIIDFIFTEYHKTIERDDEK